jgi:hypothetical protein
MLSLCSLPFSDIPETIEPSPVDVIGFGNVKHRTVEWESEDVSDMIDVFIS